jgi:hypothetical protein
MILIVLNQSPMQKLLSITALAVILSLSACDKDEEKNSSEFSKVDAQSKITAFNASATQDLQDLATADGLEAIVDLTSLIDSDDPFGGRLSTDKKRLKKFFRKKGHSFRTIIAKKYAKNGRTNGEEPFDFNNNTGLFTWNPEIGEFEKTGESDIIKIQFPTEGSASNNAELQITAYEETLILDEDFETYQPTVLRAALLVNNTEAASLDLNIEWDAQGFPLTADFNATVAPFTATLSFDVTGDDKNTLSASLLRDQRTLFSTSVTVLYSSVAKTESDLKTISGFVQLLDLKLEGNIDMEGMDNDVEHVDLNKYIKLELKSENKKVGDIIFVMETIDGVEESLPYLEYADGTKEKLEDVLKPVTDELEQLEEDLNG